MWVKKHPVLTGIFVAVVAMLIYSELGPKWLSQTVWPVVLLTVDGFWTFITTDVSIPPIPVWGLMLAAIIVAFLAWPRTRAWLWSQLRRIGKWLAGCFSRRELDDGRLGMILVSNTWTLFIDPNRNQRTKPMRFGPDGEILEGDNENEYRWRCIDGKFEMLQEDGRIHSRFFYNTDTGQFESTNDPDTRSRPNQRLVPC